MPQHSTDHRQPRHRAALHLGLMVLLFGLLGGAGFALIEYFATAKHLADARTRVLEDANRLRFQIEKTIAGEIQLILGLTAYIRARPDLDQRDFEEAADYLLGQASTTVRNIALARDLVITHIYPLAGNEAALGLVYRDSAQQWPAVQRALETGSIVIAGPVELVQGGIALIVRVPIFLPTATGADALWGMASVAIDLDVFLEAIEITETALRLDLALYGQDGRGLEGGLIFGDPGVLFDDAVLQQVALGDGSWVVAARPLDGWPTASPHRLAIFAAYLLFLLVVSLWLWRAMRSRLERERVTQALREAKAEADQASHAKSQFLATMSHELRTPLNAIIGFSDFLLSQLKPPAVQERQLCYIRDIRESGEHLLNMINDILDLARIESREVEVPLAPLDVRRAAGMALKLVYPQARAKGVRLRCALPHGLPPAIANERALQQVLINLLANAVRHTEAGRRVCLRLTRPGRAQVALVVEDEGSGIPEDKLALLGIPFATARDAFKRPELGAGLGLAISTALVERMEGTIAFASRVGEGTTVTTTLQTVEGTEASSRQENGRLTA